ncbi:unnamed protein product, partial [Staurois parvus]
MTEQGQHMQKRTLCRSRQLSAESITKDLQTLCGLQINTTIVCRQLNGKGFHGQAAASICIALTSSSVNGNHWIKWCKALCHWTLEQYLSDCIVPSVKF